MSSTEFEFIAFYPAESKEEKTKYLGSVHVFLVKEKIHFRGIPVVENGKNSIAFLQPKSSGWDERQKKRVVYPVLSFDEKDKITRLRHFLFTVAQPIIRARLGMPEHKPKATNV